MALCTQDQVEQILHVNFGSDTDQTVAQYIAWAGQTIATYIGFDPESADAINETFDPSYTDELWVAHPIIRAVTSVTVDGSALSLSDTSGYLWYSYGKLLRTGHVWSSDPQGIVVVYNGGYATVPADISFVAASIAARMFQAGAAAAVGGDGAIGVKSISLAGSDSITYTDTVSDVGAMTMALTQQDRELLDPYRYRWFV